MESFPARRTQGPKRSWVNVPKTSSLLSVLVLLMTATVATAAISCLADSQCRRDVCIRNACTSRPKTDGTCETNSHCFNSASESCISSKCVARSSTGGLCEETADCASKADQCQGGFCSAPFDPSLMVWEGNVSPLVYSGSSQGVAVDKKLFVFEASATGDANTVEVYDPRSKTWTDLGVSPFFSTYGHSVVAIGSSVFLVGGYYAGSARALFYRYDTGSKLWEKWPDLPVGRFNGGLAAVGNTVFLFGGQDDSGYLKTIFSFDTSSKSNVWTDTKALLPLASGALSATTVNTDIYLTGGTGDLTSVLKYDSTKPTTNPTSLKPMVKGRNAHMSFYEPNSKRLYAVGGLGRPDTDGQDAVEYLDLSSAGNSWVSANAPNFVGTNPSSGALIDSVFYFAGNQILQVLDVSKPSSVRWMPFANTFSPTTDGSTVAQLTSPNKITVVDTLYSRLTSVYDIASDSWKTGPYSPYFYVEKTTSALVNGQIFVMGGDYFSALATVYSLNAAGDTFTQQDDMPAAREAGCAAADGKDIYYFGGALDRTSNPVNDLFKMDTSIAPGNNLQWSTVTLKGPAPTAVMNCAAVVVNGKLLIFGGDTDYFGFSPTGKIQSFDIASQTWDPVLSVPIIPRSRLSAVFLKGYVFVSGGTNNNGATALATTEVFDVKAQSVKVIAGMLTPRYKTGLVTDGTSVFAVGGQVSGGASFPSLEKLRSP